MMFSEGEDDGKSPPGFNPRHFAVGKSFEDFAAIAAKRIDDRIKNGLFGRRQNRCIERRDFADGIKTIVGVSMVNLSIHRAMNPSLAVFFEQKTAVEGIEKPLTVI